MKIILKLIFFLAIASLLLVACGNDLPSLAVTDEPTLVYVYTDS
jgi:hypothetical protein